MKNFDCGDKDLNDFIVNRASDFQKNLLSVSYACAETGSGRILAYCSLANDKVAISDFKGKTEFNRFRRELGFPNSKRLKSYPAVKLCRLGVNVDVKNRRIGTTMLNYIKFLPKGGVYVASARLSDGRIYRSVVNIGTQPTTPGTHNLAVEAFLLDFSEDIYG